MERPAERAVDNAAGGDHASAKGWTRAQARALDELAIGTYGIPGIVLMEHAGRSVAQAILDEEKARLSGERLSCLVFCGGGNNGGDGFVIARWLDDARVNVACCCTASAESTRGDARLARDMAVRAGIRLHDVSTSDALESSSAQWRADPPPVIVDALLGTGFEGAMRPDMARAVRALNAIRAAGNVRTWAVDVPSGLDCDTGVPAEPCVRADVTATFVATKAGFDRAEARAFLGRVIVLPIGAPRAAIEHVRDGAV